jgi:hypothetical protein
MSITGRGGIGRVEGGRLGPWRFWSETGSDVSGGEGRSRGVALMGSRNPAIGGGGDRFHERR